MQTSPTTVQEPSSPPRRIIDHGSWLDVGGVRLEKRELPNVAGAHPSLREEIEKAAEHLRKSGVLAGGLTVEGIYDHVLTELSKQLDQDTDIEVEQITRRVREAAELKRAKEYFEMKYPPRF
jgi:hypothetical protein